MSTATITAPAEKTSELAEVLNRHLAVQPQESPLTHSHRCDRCGAHAHAQFTLDSGNMLLLCGHHTHVHLKAIMKSGTRKMWIDPVVLFKFKGVNVPEADHSKKGDGLTDG